MVIDTSNLENNMVKTKKTEEIMKLDNSVTTLKENETAAVEKVTVSPNDLDWTDYVLGLLSDDEKISGNPTTDGLRRIFEIALNCVVTDSRTDIVQSPSPDNEKRATAIHTLTFVLNSTDIKDEMLKVRSCSGAADVYWGNCDKIYRNHPVAVAETRAEGRALRRALKLRKVVAAEEIAKDIEDHPDGMSVGKITTNQINFMDVLSKRIDINILKLFDSLAIDRSNIYNIGYDDAVRTIKELTKIQQENSVPSEMSGYESSWK